MDIDINTYKIWENGIYIKDKTKVYWGGMPVNEADPETFEELGEENLAKDKNHVYSGDSILENLDPALLKYIGDPYYLYKNHVLYLGSASLLVKKRKLETDIDGKNYVYMGDELIKDKKNVYYAGQILKETKPEEVNTAEDAKKLKKKIIDGILGVQKQRR